MSGSGSPESSSPAGHVLGRERHRHGEDRRPHAGLAGRHPERRAAAQRRDLRLAERDVVEEEVGHLAPDHAEVGHVGLQVADEEVEDVVLAGVAAGGERRPRRRRFGRRGRLQPVEAALAGELLEVRQLAFAHPLLDEARVHPVEAEDDHLLLDTSRAGRSCRRRPASSAAASRSRAKVVLFSIVFLNVRSVLEKYSTRRGWPCRGRRRAGYHSSVRVLGSTSARRRIGLAISDAIGRARAAARGDRGAGRRSWRAVVERDRPARRRRKTGSARSSSGCRVGSTARRTTRRPS